MTPFPLRSPAGSRRTRRATVATVAGLAASLVLAACGDAGGGGGGGAAAGADCGEAPGVTDDSITVASVSPLSGPSASTFAGFVEAAEARFALQNKEGGVNGREITVEKNDDLGDGAAQVTAARNAVQQQQAFGIIAASRVDTMFDFLATQNVPVVGYPGQPAYAEDENVFGYSGGSQTGYFAEGAIARMQEAGATNLAVLAHNSPGSLNSANGMIQVAEAAGVEVGVKSFDVPLGSFDATALAIQMKEAGVDGIYAPTLTDSSISVLRAALQQGVDLKANFVSQVYSPGVAAQVSEFIQGALTATVATVPNELADENEGVQTYIDTMKEFAPDVEPSTGFAEAGYISADLFIKGVEEAGDCLTREAFIEGLRGLDDYDGGGLLVEPAVFSGGPFANGSGPYGACSWYVVREGDVWVPDAEPTCGELVKIEG
jgi:ABC-type branched-subunit amino acid transport system substrate-binding protein